MTWLGKPGELPDPVRWRWDELKQRGQVRLVAHEGKRCYVLTGQGEIWLADYWRREVVEPYVHGLTGTLGVAEIRAGLAASTDAELRRVAAALWGEGGP